MLELDSCTKLSLQLICLAIEFFKRLRNASNATKIVERTPWRIRDIPFQQDCDQIKMPTCVQ